VRNKAWRLLSQQSEDYTCDCYVHETKEVYNMLILVLTEKEISFTDN
jgi:hypothetical protein